MAADTKRRRRPRIRVVSDQDVVTDARILFVTEGDDGNDVETDISSCTQGVDLHLHIGELATATIKAIFVDTEARAEVNDVLLAVVPPKAIPGVIERLQAQLAADEAREAA